MTPLIKGFFSWCCRGCKTDQGSWRVYGEATHGGRFVGVSMPGPVTGRYFGYRKLPEPQTSSRICPGTRDIAVCNQTVKSVKRGRSKKERPG